MMMNVVTAGGDFAAHMCARAPAIYQTVPPQFDIGWRLGLGACPRGDQPTGYHAGKVPLDARREGCGGWVVQNINQSDPRIEFQFVRSKRLSSKWNNFWSAVFLDQRKKFPLGIIHFAQRCAIIRARRYRKST